MEWTAFLLSFVGSIVFLSIIFGVSVSRNRYDLIDVAWGLAFIAIALISYMTYLPKAAFSLQALVTLLVIVWGVRLSTHIYARWGKSHNEDSRYVSLRESYSKSPGGLKVNMYTRIFLLQALLASIVSLPVIILNATPALQPSALTLIGVMVWIVGFCFETVGDYQLKQFIASPSNKGKLMTTGVWKYTRHPNYFGEITQWWGIFIIVVIALPAYWWLAIVGPIVITILLLFVSGVPLTEKHFADKPGWDEYKKRTSKLLPLPRKKG